MYNIFLCECVLQLAQVKEYMRFRHLPHDLQKRVYSYYEHRFQTHSHSPYTLTTHTHHTHTHHTHHTHSPHSHSHQHTSQTLITHTLHYTNPSHVHSSPHTLYTPYTLTTTHVPHTHHKPHTLTTHTLTTHTPHSHSHHTSHTLITHATHTHHTHPTHSPHIHPAYTQHTHPPNSHTNNCYFSCRFQRKYFDENEILLSGHLSYPLQKVRQNPANVVVQQTKIFKIQNNKNNQKIQKERKPTLFHTLSLSFRFCQVFGGILSGF